MLNKEVISPCFNVCLHSDCWIKAVTSLCWTERVCSLSQMTRHTGTSQQQHMRLLRVPSTTMLCGPHATLVHLLFTWLGTDPLTVCCLTWFRQTGKHRKETWASRISHVTYLNYVIIVNTWGRLTMWQAWCSLFLQDLWCRHMGTWSSPPVCVIAPSAFAFLPPCL